MRRVLRFCLLLLCRPLQVHGGLSFPTLANGTYMHAPLCVPIHVNAVQCDDAAFPITANWVLAEADICSGDGGGRYDGKVVFFADIDKACGLSGSILGRARKAYDIGAKVGAAAVLDIQGHTKKRTPGNT